MEPTREPSVLCLFPEEDRPHDELPRPAPRHSPELEAEAEAGLAMGDMPVLVERGQLALPGHFSHPDLAVSCSTDLRPQGQAGLLDISRLHQSSPELRAEAQPCLDWLDRRKIWPRHVFWLPRLALAEETSHQVDVLLRDIQADIKVQLLIRERWQLLIKIRVVSRNTGQR